MYNMYGIYIYLQVVSNHASRLNCRFVYEKKVKVGSCFEQC